MGGWGLGAGNVDSSKMGEEEDEEDEEDAPLDWDKTQVRLSFHL